MIYERRLYGARRNVANVGTGIMDDLVFELGMAVRAFGDSCSDACMR